MVDIRHSIKGSGSKHGDTIERRVTCNKIKSTSKIFKELHFLI